MEALIDEVIEEHQPGLARTILENTALLLEEKKRRVRENGIKYYMPQLQQIPFHLSTKRIRAAFGGNRSGKTVGGSCEAVWYATGTHPSKKIPIPNFGRIICTDFTNGIEKVILPEIYKWMPKDMIERYHVESRTMYLKNGSSIAFMSYDQDIDKFESASLHWVWMDEEPPQGVFKANQVRVLDTRGDIWLTMTPIKGLTWVYEDVYEQFGIDKAIDVFVYDTRDNPYVDNESIDDLMSGMSEQEIETRLGGKFVQMSGLIYREYSPDIHNIPTFEIPAHWPKVQSIDPHPRQPTVAVYLAVAPVQHFISLCYQHGIKLPEIFAKDNEDIYVVYDEVYPEAKSEMLIGDVCQVMHAKEAGDYISYRLIDNSANEPNPVGGVTIRKEFENNGIRTTLADKNVSNRIFAVREKLKRHTLFFMNQNVKNTVWEIRHYAWDDFKIGKDYKDPKEKPRKKRDHAMDNLGYICVSKPKYERTCVYKPDRKTINKHTGY